MSALPLSPSVDRAGPIVDARAVAPLSHAEAGALARVELERFIQLIDSLGVLDFPRTGARVDAWGELLRPAASP